MFGQNPWLTIWTRPRETIRSIVQENPKRSLWLLAFIYGLASLVGNYQSISFHSKISFSIWIVAMIALAAVWGYAIFAIWSYVIVWVGKIFKGKADFQAARAAYAWSCVPLIGSLFLWGLLWVFFPQIVISGGSPEIMVTGFSAIALFLIVLGKAALSIWSLVIYLQALAEVQQFSVLKAIGNVILGAVAVAAVIFVIGLAFIYLTQGTVSVPTAAVRFQEMYLFSQYFE